MVQHLADLIGRLGGALLLIDYGHARTAAGDTFQAVARHEYADPWINPGEHDLTAHVDFESLAAAGRGAGLRPFGPRGQGEWLETMGIGLRAAALSKAAPSHAEEVAAARHRLTDSQQIGTLFKVMALVAPGWPEPAGF